MNYQSILFKAIPVACSLAFLGPKTAMASPMYIFTKVAQTQPATTQDPAAFVEVGAPVLSEDGTVVFYGLKRPSTNVTVTTTGPETAPLVTTVTVTTQESALYKRLTNGTLVTLFSSSNFSRTTTYSRLSGANRESKSCRYEPRVSGKNTTVLASCSDSSSSFGGRTYTVNSRNLLLLIDGKPLPSPVASGSYSQYFGTPLPDTASISGTTVTFDQGGKVYTFNGSQADAKPVEVASGFQPLVDRGNLLFFGVPALYSRINGTLSQVKLPPTPSGSEELRFGACGDIKGERLLFCVGAFAAPGGQFYQAIYTQKDGKQTKLLDNTYNLAAEKRRFGNFTNALLSSENFGFIEIAQPAVDGSSRSSIYVSSRIQVKPVRVLSTNSSIATLSGNVPIKNFSVSPQYLQGKKVVVSVELADGGRAIYLGKPQGD
jgi:hypothetical protein